MRRITVVIAAGVLAASMVVGGAVAASADAGDGTACVKGHWPADVQGRPGNLQPLGPTGLYVWHDGDGWSIRVTHASKSHVTFTGKIYTDGQLYGVAKRTESNDRVMFEQDADGVRYRFQNYGGLDGIDFHTRCANRLVFYSQLDGKDLKPMQIFIGANAHHPGGVPFEIRRTR